MRPDYVNNEDTVPSIETWERACADSQKWADRARLAALHRKQFRFALAMALILLVLTMLIVLVLLLTGVLKP